MSETIMAGLGHLNFWLSEHGVPYTAEIHIQFPGKPEAVLADLRFQDAARAFGMSAPVDREPGDLTVADPDYIVQMFGRRLRFVWSQ